MKWRSASTVNGVSRTVNVPAFDDGVQDADDLRGALHVQVLPKLAGRDPGADRLHHQKAQPTSDDGQGACGGSVAEKVGISQVVFAQRGVHRALSLAWIGNARVLNYESQPGI